MSTNNTGRPTKFKEEYIELAYNYCLLGATDQDLAKFFDVAESTINKWKLDYPRFSESLKKGKVDADALVAKSLFKRAIGYTYKELKEEESEHGVKNTVTVKEVAPDTTAQIFWLKNRQPAKWRDKQEVEMSVNPLEDILDEIECEAREAQEESKE